MEIAHVHLGTEYEQNPKLPSSVIAPTIFSQVKTWLSCCDLENEVKVTKIDWRMEMAHVHNYLNYLLRVGSQKMWSTNPLTIGPPTEDKLAHVHIGNESEQNPKLSS